MLSVFSFFWVFLTSCVFFVGFCPFGNKFLFIQKKKKAAGNSEKVQRNYCLVNKGFERFQFLHLHAQILLNDNAKSYIEHQRRLNPVMKDVVRKEVLKWLNAGFIYAISGSSWVSPVHVVPKKGGFKVIRNEKNELIPTRTVTG